MYLTYGLGFLGMLDIVRHCTYIGMADDVFAVLQHDTHLYLANVVNLRYMLLYIYCDNSRNKFN